MGSSSSTMMGARPRLQRSPSYIAAAPRRDRLADLLHRALPKSLVRNAIRWRNVLLDLAMFQLSRRWPSLVKALMRRETAKQLPVGYDAAKHFTPNYDPWDQRVRLAPDGDLFTAIRDGRASVVTDVVDTFTPDGIRLESGPEIAADIVVTATGLTMLALGEVEVSVDGSPVDLGSTVSYKGMMVSGVPNFFWTLGYTNASWTLKADLISRYVCRLIDHLDGNRYSPVTPLPPADGELAPLMDLSSGYVRRGIDQFPKQGAVVPWHQQQNYLRDLRLFTRGPLDDHVLFAAGPEALRRGGREDRVRSLRRL
jgi:monooxygenase